MFYIKSYDRISRTTIILAKTEDPGEAYELAHQFDAQKNLGPDKEDEDYNENEKPRPCVISIQDENGANRWDECARARCPSVGLQ